MAGTLFFYAIILLSVGIFIGFSYFKLRGQQYFIHDGVAITVRVGSEHSLLALIFAVLPFLMYELLAVRVMTWDVTSLLLGVVMLFAWGRIVWVARTLHIRWHLFNIIIVALYGIIAIITLANAFWWHTLEGYMFGVMWMVGIALVQLFTLVYFDPDPIPKTNSIRYHYHGSLLGRLWRNRRSGRPNRSPNNHTVAHTNPVDHARRERYTDGFAFTRPPKSNRRSVAHTTLRSNKNT